MVSIRLAGPADLPWLSERGRHVDLDELGAVVRRERVILEATQIFLRKDLLAEDGWR